jgi:hypothetical protein
VLYHSLSWYHYWLSVKETVQSVVYKHKLPMERAKVHTQTILYLVKHLLDGLEKTTIYSA